MGSNSIRGEEGNKQAMMVITMIIFVRILIHKMLLNPATVFVNVFKQPKDLHPVFLEYSFYHIPQLLLTSNRNLKFISSIIYQGIMDLYTEQLENVFIEGNENNVRLVAPADPIFAPSTLHCCSTAD